MKTLHFLSLVTIGSLSSAQQAPRPCTDFSKTIGAFRFHRFESHEGRCFLSATPIFQPNYVYRSYTLTQDGMLMVFNSIDPKLHQGISDGARVYYFFPRNQTPTIDDEAQFISVETATSGFKLNLDMNKPQVFSVTGADFKEDSQVTPMNKGGLEIFNSQFLYLDAGYANSTDPTSFPNGKSKFVSPRGKSCDVTNKEVFNWDSDGDPRFKFTDAELALWLKKRCPQL